VDDHTQIEADSVVIATGSSPHVPDLLQGLGDRLVVNDDVFEWRDLPQSVAVFGPGVIGLELGQALHRLGVRVTIFGRGGRVGTLTDPELVENCIQTMSTEFDLEPNAHVREAKAVNGGVDVTYCGKSGATQTRHFEFVLAATGRRPNPGRLGLENTSLVLNAKGLPSFDPFTLQADETAIFIAGDVNDTKLVLHEASDEGRIAGENAARFPDIRAGLRRAPLSIVFSDPQIALAGNRHADLPCECFATGKVSFVNQGRSRVMLMNKGALHVYAERGTGLFMGAEMFGPRAENIGHLLAWAYQQRLTVKEMLDMPFYHPVVEEGLRTALRDVNSKLHLGPAAARPCFEYGPGV